MPGVRLAVALAVLAVVAAAEEPRAGPVPEPAGYRGEPYRADVPATLTGATTVGTTEARDLWRHGETVFVDVMPRTARPDGLPPEAIWREKPRATIPGAVWLPNVGYEVLNPDEESYLRAGLAAATRGDLSRPVLFFCLDRCWMSWNAAKRGLSLGYRRVIWYPQGTDGWAEAGLPLVETAPWSPAP